MQIGSTQGTLPPSTPTYSLILADDLSDFQLAWASPVSTQQDLWRNSADQRASQSTSGTQPLDFTTAATDASIAKAAALRWAMAGDVADLTKAIDALLVAEIPGGTSITRPEVLTSYLSAYDYIRGASFTDLPQSTRDLIESELLSLANSLSSGLTDSNAKGKIGATRALAGLLLMDQTLLNRGLQDLQNHFNYSTTDDGWFADSQGHYLNYTLSHITVFVRAYERGSGVDLFPNLNPYAEMSIGMRMPGGVVPNVSNGTNTPVAIHMFSQDPALSEAELNLWNISEGLPATFSWSTTNLVNNDWYFTNLFALTDFTDVVPQSPAFSPTFFSPGQAKVSVFREDWSPTSDWLMLSPGVDSPAGLFNIPAFHSHNDTAELLLCAHGEYLLVASGYNRTDLSNSPPGFAPQRADWHNVVLVDGNVGNSDQGRKMRPEDFQYRARLDAVEDGTYKGACDYVSLETRYRETDVVRSMAFPNEDYFLVADWLAANQPRDFGFNLVGRGVQTVSHNSSDKIEVSWEYAGVWVQENLFASQALSLSTASLHMHDTFNQFESTQRMTGTQRATTGGFLSILETGLTGNSSDLVIQEISGASGTLAVEVQSISEAWKDWHLSMALGQVQEAGVMSLNGKYAYLREWNSDWHSFALVDGTGLGYEQALVMGATSPLTISATATTNGVKATISPQGFVPMTELRWYGQGDLQSASLDGTSLTVSNGQTYSAVVLDGVVKGSANVLEVVWSGPSSCGFETYGFGTDPANDLVLSGHGVPSPGANISFASEGDLQSTIHWLAISTQSDQVSRFGGTAWIDESQIQYMDQSTAANGVATFFVTLPNDPGLIGSTFYAQSLTQDASKPGGWALSHGLQMTICP